MLSNEAPKVDPALVLLGFYTANDVSDNSAALQATLPAARGRVDRRPYLDPSSAWRVIPPNYLEARRSFDEALGAVDTRPTPIGFVQRTALYGLLRDVRRRFGAPNDRLRVPTDGYQPFETDQVYLCEDTALYDEAWRLTERIIARLAADVRSSGARFVVFSVPSYPEVKRPNLPEQFCVDRPPSDTRLASILAEHGVEYIDLLPAFRHADRTGADLFWASDLHWTDEGHALAAQIVAQRLGELRPH